MKTTTQATKVGTNLGLAYPPEVFNDEATAFRVAARWAKRGAVMLGDNGQYWVVCLADAVKLEAAGYEWAPKGVAL